MTGAACEEAASETQEGEFQVDTTATGFDDGEGQAEELKPRTRRTHCRRAARSDIFRSKWPRPQVAP